MTADILRIRTGEHLTTSSPEVEFALVISRAIDSVKENPAELRNAIYEVARVKLQREASQSNPPMNILELRRITIALETAIELVEVISSRKDELRALKSLDRLIENLNKSQPGSAINPFHSTLVLDHAPIANADANRLPPALAKRVALVFSQLWFKHGAAPLVRASFVAIFALALYVMFNGRFEFLRSPTAPVDNVAPSTLHTRNAAIPDLVPELPFEVVRPSSPTGQAKLRGFPLPTVYGIYAISNGELHELDALPGKVPDQRIFMSAVLNKPSRATLPDGRIAFVAFRRDLSTSAPDRVSVRVIAKIMRALTFSPGRKATIAAVDNSWAVRNVSYDFRVAPLSDNPEMLVMRPEHPDFVLPAGRYGMILNGLAYDFTVAGQITEAAHCLERTEAANGTFYSECRKP